MEMNVVIGRGCGREDVWGGDVDYAISRHRMYFAALLMSAPPVYSGRYFSNGTLWSLFLKTSILFGKRMIDVLGDRRELITESKSTNDSAIRFCIRARSV